MKKTFAVMLAVAMLASLACIGTSAAVRFRDTFDTWESYWAGSDEVPVGDNRRNELDDGNWVLEGWKSARVHQADYENGDETGGYKNSKSSLVTGTFWVDLYAEIEDSDDAGAGLWWKNTYYKTHEGADSDDTFTLKYYPTTSTVKFVRDFPDAATDEEKVLASYEVPGAPGANIDSMVPVTLGMRVEAGKISAFVNGKFVGSFDDKTIGIDACPVILWNDGLHAYWDNYCVGDLAELPLPNQDTNNNNNNTDTNAGGGNGTNGGGGNVNNNVDSTIVTKTQDVTDASGNAVTDASGNKVTQIVSEVVTVPAADTNKGPSGNGGAQTGDMAVVVLAVMVVALGSAVVVKKASSK